MPITKLNVWKKVKNPFFLNWSWYTFSTSSYTANVMDKGWGKKRIGQISGVAKVIFEIRQPLRHAPIGFILEPKDFENCQFSVKSPHLVTLMWLLPWKIDHRPSHVFINPISRQSFSKRQHILAVFLDITKPFDTTW